MVRVAGCAVPESAVELPRREHTPMIVISVRKTGEC